MKIKKTSSKKLAPLPKPLRDIIDKLKHDAEETIPSFVEELNDWPYRRGDMFHWVPVLDRFDTILERICNDFHLQQQVQSRPFDSNTKALLLAITSILKVLFEHCTNRNIYNSFEHINALLNTMDIDVLENTMQFMLKPAQRLNQPAGMASSFAPPQDKITEMARSWGFPTSNLVHLVSNDFNVTKDMTTLHMRFYRSDNNKEEQQQQQQSDQGVIDFTVNVAPDNGKSDIQVFQELSKQYDIPSEYHFELAHQIQVKRNLANVASRNKLLKIRILAIAIMELTVSESTASNQIFMQEPHLIAGLGELVHPEKNIDYDLQVCSLRALAAIAENRRTINDVLTAINASANHGVFLRILRMIANGSISDYPWQFLDGLFMTLSSILNSQSGMQMLVSAGLVPVLTQLLGNSKAVTNKLQSKVIAVLDGIMHGSSSSFTNFCNIGGLDTLLGRIKDEVNECLEYNKDHQSTAPEFLEPDVFELQKTTGILELYDRISALRAMLRFLWRMMDSSGTADRLRNLVESSILSSLVSIISEPYVFGSNCFVSAINIMTTIIHSEPTSLTILQEVKLPQTFLDTICRYDTPSTDVLMPAVNAFGAICLNPQGINMFKEANPLPHFFDLFCSREYAFQVEEPDIMTGLGNAFDELVRHHPSLKPDVITCITTMVKRVIEMGQSHDENTKSKNDGHLLKTASTTRDETTTTTTKDAKEEKSDNRLVLFIDRTARFLEGFFQTHSNIRAAIKEGLPDLLLDFYALPALPADFSTTAASDSLAFVIKIINDINMSSTILEIAKRVKKASQFILEDTSVHTSSMLQPFVDISDDDTNQFEAGNALFRKFIVLHGYIGLLSDISYSAGLSLGRSSSSLVAELLSGEDEDSNTIELVGAIYRFIMWENFLLKESVPSHWYNFTQDKANDKSASASHLALGSNGNRHASNSSNGVSNDENNKTGDSHGDLSGKENIDAKDPRIQNLRYFKLFLGETTHSIMVLLQGSIMMTCSRRTMDADQKAISLKLSRSIAELLKRNVLWMRDANNSKKLPMCKHNYRTVMYSMISLLFLEDRPQASLYTPAAVAFDQQGGTDMLLHDLDSLWQKISLLHMVPSAERTKEQQTLISNMYGSLEALLTAIACVGSSKLLRDSPYTAPMVKRGNKTSDAFDPYRWIISMQLKLTPIQQYLHSPDAKEFPKSVLQVLLKIVLHAFKGEGESNFNNESRTTTATTPASTFRIPPFQQRNRAPNPTILRAPPVSADQNGVQRLVDMGFDRNASELAMVRCHNQISRAVDYLFTYPGETTADTNASAENTSTTTSSQHQSNNDNEDTTQQEAPDSQDIFEGGLGDADSDFDDSDDEFNDWRHQILDNINRTPITSSRPTQQSQQEEHDTGNTEEERKMVQEQAQKLAQMRAKMKSELPSLLVRLACQRDDLLFDIRHLLLAFFKSDSDTKTASTVMSLVIDRVDEIRQDNQSENAQLSTCLLLLALLFKEPIVQDAIPNVAPRLEFLFGLVHSVDTSDPEKALPSWLATVLLVIETLIAQADDPKQKSTTPQDESQKPNRSTPLVSVEQCQALLVDCINLLKCNDISRNDIYAILRIVVRLTRDYDAAREFVKHDGLQMLFSKARSKNHSGSGLQGLQAFIILIFRHVIESKTVLGKRMEDIISTWFTVPRPRNMDIRTYLRNNGHVALRDPSTFLNVSGQICRITRYDRHSENPHIKLLSKNSSATSKDESDTSTEKNATVPVKNEQQHEPDIENASIVIDYLLEELTSACNNSLDDDHQSTTENSHYAYTGFILQCLVELVSSYNTCKHALYAFCQRSNNKDNSIVHMLINDLLPYNAVNPNVESRKQQGLSIWTASILVAMCYDTGGANNDTNTTTADKERDLDPIRRYIFDIIVCTFKDTITCTKSGSLSIKYGKYLALADLCHRILNARPSAGAPAQQRIKEETTIHIAKLMINKQLISVLTMAINDIDIEYPHARTVINSMLRPLEQLTSFGSKMTDVEQQSKQNDETNLEQQLLQDTPDLFNDEDADEQMDETSNEDGYGQDDFDDSTTDSSSDIPAREDDDVEVIDMLEQDAMEQENGDQMQLNGDHAAESTVQEEDDEPHMTWELEDFDHESIMRGTGGMDTPESPIIMNGRRNYRDLVDVLVDEEHVDDLDALDQSDFDEDEGSENLDDMNDGDDFMEDRAMMDADMDEDYYLGDEDRDNRFSRSLPRIDLQRTELRRSSRLPILPLPRGIFRPLGVSAETSVDQDQVINHPLLSEEYQGANGVDSNNMMTRPTRSSFGGPMTYSRPPRLIGGQSMWQAFEHTVGDSAIRLLESYLMRAASGTGARRGMQSSSLGFDVRERANGIMRSFELELRNNPRVISNSNMTRSPLEEQTQPDADSNRELLSMLHDFQPMTCADRWNQEARMLYGTSVPDKSQNLLNPLLNILVPIVMEEERRMREKEEQRREEQRRLQEERRKKEEEERRRHEEEERKRKEHDDAYDSEQQSATTTANGSGMDTSASIQEQDQHRRMITINGELVDISQTGLDVEFLEALPDDLRREVVNDHMRISRSRMQATETESISSEFLGALPPEIRDEVLQQEAFSRERRERQQQQEQQQADTPLPTQVLNGHAPSPLGLPDPPSRRFRLSDEFQRLVTEFGRNDHNGTGEDANQQKNNTRQNAIQLVDRGELASLARLLFALQPISKSILSQLLVNLCENTQTRSDLLSLLVCVLHDGSNDLTAVDQCFAKVIQSSSSSPSKISDKNMTTSSTTQAAPNLIIQRCLNFLMQLIQSNDRSLGYFLVENDRLADLKRNSTAKGKSKMQAPSSKYPLLVLISLLDRDVFVDNPSLMEDLMRLISTLCRPFPVLVKKYMDRVNSNEKDSASKPPVIPDQYLLQVVHVLLSGECSSKTFQYTISALSHLSTLDGAMQTIMHELMQGAKSCYEQVASDLDDLHAILDKATSDTELQGSTLSQFSGASSHQAKLLRVLKTIDYVYSRQSSTSSSSSSKDSKEQSVLKVYEELALLSLWDKLGDCLVAIRERDYLLNVATVILPLMESLMVVYKYAADQAQEGFFFTFTERHRKILNTMVRNNPSLMLGSFSLLVRNPKVLEFDNKRNYFVQQLHKRTSSPRQHYPSLQLNVRRRYVFQDSYHQLLGKTGDEIKYGRLNVQFRDEDGVDAGGVSREWYSVLARQMFDPNYALFITSTADKLTYQPNRASSVNPDHLSYLKFVGRVIGKAIYDGRLLDAYFTRSFYKHILGRSVDYKDMAAIDHEYYKSLVWMLENDITDVIDLTFSLEVDDFGTTHVIDLKPDGRNLPVTEDNKHEYVSLVTEHRLTTAIKDQIEAFLQGFHEIIPASLIQIFNEQELELLISGLPDIDIDDWKNNTEYQGGYSSNSTQIQWFWRAVRSFDQEERAKLLQFATGTSKVPLEGFAHLQGSGGVQKFQIHKQYSSNNRLPTAHTCFNQIDLPMYESYASLRHNLFKAINECATGFGFV